MATLQKLALSSPSCIPPSLCSPSALSASSAPAWLKKTTSEGARPAPRAWHRSELRSCRFSQHVRTLSPGSRAAAASAAGGGAVEAPLPNYSVSGEREASGRDEYYAEEDEEPGPVEEWLEERVFNSRFLTLTAVVGSLLGATLCFVKGSIFILEAARWFFLHVMSHNTGRVIMLLVEALDVYLMGTVMLIFGMGLYELFIDSPSSDHPSARSRRSRPRRSSFFGLFRLRSRPKWLTISSLEEMKTKLGHVIVMILLVGMFEKSKKVVITSATDLLMFSASVALAAGCLLILTKLHSHGDEHTSPSPRGGAHAANGYFVQQP